MITPKMTTKNKITIKTIKNVGNLEIPSLMSLYKNVLINLILFRTLKTS